MLVIVGLAMMIAMPAFSHYKDTLARRQARQQLIEDIRLARQLSVTQHTQVVLAFGNGVGVNDVSTYTIHADNNGDGVRQAGEAFWNRKMPKSTILNNVALSPTDSLIFDISGILRPGTTGGQLAFKTSRNLRDTLCVSAVGMVYRP